MTAYGRASDTLSIGKMVVEIHSVNRKMLDVSVYLPKDLLRFDIDVRKWIASEVERGQISVRVSLHNQEDSAKLAQNQLLQLKSLQSGWNQVAEGLNFDPKQSIDLQFLIAQLQQTAYIESAEQEQEFKIILQRVVHAALDELMQMKRIEGQTLCSDIQKRLKFIEEQLIGIEKKKEDPYERYRQKILVRLQEIGQIDPEIEERILRELIFLAERLDVTEELVRLRAHIAQFRQHIISTDKAIGRTLEFLTQEMLREINTLGSKSIDTDVSIFVVMIKSELEKIREQIQNLE